MKKEIKKALEHLHSYDKMVEKNDNLSYPKCAVQDLMKKVEEFLSI
jgi:hypothetical protein